MVGFMQPGYLHGLIPDSAPIHPESLQTVLHGLLFCFALLFFWNANIVFWVLQLLD